MINIKDILKNRPIKYSILGIYQLSGGLIALISMASQLTKLETFSLELFLSILIIVGLYSYSIFCGILLLRRKKIGITHSLINQFLQLINFSVAGFTFQYASGLFFTFGFDFTMSLFQFDFGISSWQIIFNGESNNLSINFNIAALILIIFIDKLNFHSTNVIFTKEISIIGTH